MPRFRFPPAVVAGCLAVALLAGAARAETVIQGTIDGGTWTPAGNPYVVMGRVYSTGDLTIEAGTIVRFAALNITRGLLQTAAALTVNGTEANPVVFESIDSPVAMPSMRWGGVSGDGPMTITGAIFRDADTCVMADGAGPVVVSRVRFETSRLGMHVGVGRPMMDRITAFRCETGIQIHGVGGQMITNAAFVENTKQGVDPGASVTIVNATFDRNRAAITRFFTVTTDVRNSIFSNNQMVFEAISDSGTITFTNCGLWANTKEYVPSAAEQTLPGTTIMRVDPRYVSATDLHLTAQSPYIDAGSAMGAPDHDLDGRPRPVGSGYDIGAYEFSAAGGAGGMGGIVGAGGAGAGGMGGSVGAGGAGAGGQGGTAGTTTVIDAGVDTASATGGSGSGGASATGGNGSGGARATGGSGGAGSVDAGQGHKASGAGCGCRVGGGTPGGVAWLISLAVVGAAVWSRRSRRR